MAMMDIAVAVVCVDSGASSEADCGALLVAGVDVKVDRHHVIFK